jgi:uncharacterized protein (TIGR02145 family)
MKILFTKFLTLAIIFIFSFLLAGQTQASNNLASDNLPLEDLVDTVLSRQDTEDIIRVIDDKIEIVERNIQASSLINLTRIPTNVRTNFLNLSLHVHSNLQSLRNEVVLIDDVNLVKNRVMQKEQETSIAQLSVVYNNVMVLLTNYNRLFDLVQAAYLIVNNATLFITNNSGQYDIAYAHQLTDLKNNRLDPLYNEINNKIINIGNLDFSSDLNIDQANREIISALVIDLSGYRSDFLNLSVDINQIVGNVLSHLEIETSVIGGIDTFGDVISFACGSDIIFVYNGLLETYGTIEKTISGTTYCWLDRNLGASQVCTSSTDSACYGDLFQWGRGADGHQIRTSGTTSILSSSDTPGHGFITTSAAPHDWRNPQKTGLWQGEARVNNPCPSGWRVPTEAELSAERLSWSTNNSAGAYASTLNWSVAGYRYNIGSLYNVGSSGLIWSSTVSSTASRYLFFASSGSSINGSYRAYGLSVRCLRD